MWSECCNSMPLIRMSDEECCPQDLAPCDFHLFPLLNGRRRTAFWHNELQTSVENYLKAQAAGFYDEGIGKLVPVPHYEKCLRRSVA